MFIFNSKIIYMILGTGQYVPRAVFIDLEPSVIGKDLFENSMNVFVS